jgi:acetyltransferase
MKSVSCGPKLGAGEHVLIRPVQPEDMALYPDFLRDVSPDDLRLRFFAIARVAELSAAEIKKLGHLDYSQEMAFVALMKTRVKCSGWCA